ncbi:MAG: DUF3119 family protein [Synechococcaceae cyanobacterium]|nr:DUF3119 family protein [Synechococcaceae cyanobacterium]
MSSSEGSDPTLPDPAAVLLLAPRVWVPLGLLVPGMALALLAWQRLEQPLPWLIAGSLVALFGLFLAVQAALLRLRFDAQGLQVLRGGGMIRSFPWSDWIVWRLFWPGLPVLFYFRERRSIHLLPMLFDADALRAQLEQRVGPAATPIKR